MTEELGDVVGEFLYSIQPWRRLSVNRNDLVNCGICERLKKNDTLEYLDLGDTELSREERGEMLKNLLVKNTSLAHLNFVETN